MKIPPGQAIVSTVADQVNTEYSVISLSVSYFKRSRNPFEVLLTKLLKFLLDSFNLLILFSAVILIGDSLQRNQFCYNCSNFLAVDFLLLKANLFYRFLSFQYMLNTRLSIAVNRDPIEQVVQATEPLFDLVPVSYGNVKSHDYRIERDDKLF